jgi:hypothetical protein
MPEDGEGKPQGCSTATTLLVRPRPVGLRRVEERQPLSNAERIRSIISALSRAGL